MKLSFGMFLLMLNLASIGILPANSKENSVATRVAGGDYPLNLLEIDRHFLVSTNNGYGTQYLQSYDESRRKVIDRLELPSLWFGLAYQPATKRLIASDGKSGVYTVSFEDGSFGKPRLLEVNGCGMTAGLVFSDQETALVACNQTHNIIQFDVRTGTVQSSLQVGEFPFVLAMLPGKRVAVSNWGQSTVTIAGLGGLKKLIEIKVGSHPNHMLVIPEVNSLLVSSSDSDSLSLIDLNLLREIRRIDLHPPGQGLFGVQPNALAQHRGKLFVALAAVDAIAVLQVEKDKDLDISFLGVFPVGAFPTALTYSEQMKTLFIANGRNLVTGPNALPRTGTQPFRYIGDILGGGIEAITDSELEKYHPRLLSLADQIYGSKDANPCTDESFPPIKYVFYIIKENRSYDQVLGDMREGNGSPELALFGEKVTPNHHALAREYILFDSFYVNGDVSADGHLWSTAAVSTEYVNKVWPLEYSKRAPGVLDAPYDGDADHDRPIGVPQSGFLWDRLLEAGITFRNYGEWYVGEQENPEKVHVYLAGLKDHSDLNFRSDIGDVTDQQRVDEWQREFNDFERNGKLPRFSLLYLPNDHTVGTKAGYRTPTAMVADNDLALGRVVERISRSRYWPQSAIFVLEDDAQDGPDHLDAHRSPLLLISPFTKRHAVSHTTYSTVSVVKTMAQILSIGPLTYFDARARSLLCEFQKKPLVEVYQCRRPVVSLEEKNSPDAPGAKESAEWDFRGPDRAPWLELNRVIWKSVKGQASEPPPPVFRVTRFPM